jgi:uncharacterized protein (DUF302 family)
VTSTGRTRSLRTPVFAGISLAFIAAAHFAGLANAQDSKIQTSTYADSKSASAPLPVPSAGGFTMPTLPKEEFKPNTFSEGVSAEAKMKAAQSMMLFNPLSMRQMMSMMVAKKKAKSGLKFDEVVDSMKLKANQRNFKLVGHNPLSKDVVAISGKTDTPRVEIFSFCDAIVAREILDYSPEFIAFLPCRIAVLEDAQKAIWLVTLDWDVRWLDTSLNPNKMPESVRAKAIQIRESIELIMEAGANGDL